MPASGRHYLSAGQRDDAGQRPALPERRTARRCRPAAGTTRAPDSPTMPASGRHYRVDYASKAGSFFFTATFFSVTYFGSPSDPYGNGASPLISGAR